VVLYIIWYFFGILSKMDPKKDVKKDGKKKVKKKKVSRKAQKISSTESIASDAPKADSPSCCSSSMNYAIVALLVLVAGFAVYSMIYQAPDISDETTTTLQHLIGGEAQYGSVVAIDYTGRFDDGEVFDTSIREIAQREGVYNPLRDYEPLMFQIGYGGLIPAFESQIIGMGVGETREFMLSSEQAYGERSQEYIEKIEKKQVSPSIQTVTLARFIADIGEQPYEGMEFQIPESDEIGLNWPLRVLEVTEDSVVFKYIALEPQAIDTVFGEARVYGDGDDIVIEITAEIGQEILTLSGPATVIGVDDTYVTVDFNHPLAGKDLYFEVTLVEILG
jgi:FKBP-type peptidyl-prolyl cis-trans isomerase 2